MRKPDFIIAGVAKAGTTSLYNYLGEHPDIGLSHKKELNYFAYEDPYIRQQWAHLPFPATSWEQYLASFSNVDDAPVIGEASPIYFESEVAPHAIRERLPDAKIIISLRNPIERAYSGYLMHVRGGEPQLTDEQILESAEHFITGGYYSEKLKRYLNLFPSDQLEIVLFDDLKQQPKQVMKQLFVFLGVADTNFEPALSERHNKGSYPRINALNAFLKSELVQHRLAPAMPAWVRRYGNTLVRINSGDAPPMSDTVRHGLQELYRNDIRTVAEIIGRDLSHWVQTP